jgi:hypothetical protein
MIRVTARNIDKKVLTFLELLPALSFEQGERAKRSNVFISRRADACLLRVLSVPILFTAGFPIVSPQSSNSHRAHIFLISADYSSHLSDITQYPDSSEIR